MPVPRKRKSKGEADVPALPRIGQDPGVQQLQGEWLRPSGEGDVQAVPGQGAGERVAVSEVDHPASYRCALCRDTGFVLRADAEGHQRAHPCECRARDRMERLVVAAGLPKRYAQASLANCQPQHPSQHVALMLARAFVREWPAPEERGLLFVGPVGTGKTHLAIAMLRELTLQRGARCAFHDVRSLLAKVRDSYSRKDNSEEQLLRPLLESELTILDELGAARSTDWSCELVERIISERYNSGLPTIATTNFAIRPPARPIAVPTPSSAYSLDAARASTAPETLGDRLGVRALSRLVERCRVVPVDGPDRRMASLEAIR